MDTDPVTVYQQSTVNPCVIGHSNCQNPATFPYFNAGAGGAGSVFDSFSPTYTVAQIAAILDTNSFVIGMDWNKAAADQSLYFFEAIYTLSGGGTSVDRFETDDPNPLILDATNQGNGYSDFLLSGFSVPGTATHVQFHAKWFNNNGADRFFLIGANAPDCTTNPELCPPQPDPVPEPATLTMLGLGLAGLAARARRRMRKQT